MLQNSNVAAPRIFRENKKRQTITDPYTLSRGAEIAGEFNARGSVPSRLYTEDAPTARRIFDHLCKTTFATQSTRSGPRQIAFAVLHNNAATVPPYTQFNVGVAREFLLSNDPKPVTVRFDVVNLFDTVYQIRRGTGIGVFAPQYGPRAAATSWAIQEDLILWRQTEAGSHADARN